MIRRFPRFLGMAVDIVLPPRCAMTGQVVDRPGVIAPEAWSSLRFITDPCCATCGYPFDFDGYSGDTQCAACLRRAPPYASARAALVYDEASRGMILKFKHGDATHQANGFALWMARAGGERLRAADVLVPVPLHPWRLLRRRYNQAAILAQALARQAGKPCVPDALLRRRATVAQGHKGYRERHRNVRGAFAVNPRRAVSVAGRSVVLVDDVYTSGATVKECAKTLVRGGARDVHILTIARTVRPDEAM